MRLASPFTAASLCACTLRRCASRLRVRGERTDVMISLGNRAQCRINVNIKCVRACVCVCHPDAQTLRRRRARVYNRRHSNARAHTHERILIPYSVSNKTQSSSNNGIAVFIECVLCVRPCAPQTPRQTILAARATHVRDA